MYLGVSFKRLPRYYKPCNLSTCDKKSLKFASDQGARIFYFEDTVSFCMYHSLQSKDFPGILNLSSVCVCVCVCMYVCMYVCIFFYFNLKHAPLLQ